MKCVVFVIVRTDSTRLPRKALLKIGKEYLIKILIERIRITNPKEIVVCTTNENSDDKITELLQNEGIDVFRGSKDDVLQRIHDAAKIQNVDKFVIVEGDDLFCDPMLIKETCKMLYDADADFIRWKNFPLGSSPLGLKIGPLIKLIKLKKNCNTDTGWGLSIVKSGLFKVKEEEPKKEELKRPEIRLTIDYKEDFKLAKILLKNLPEKFSLKDIINLLDKNPEWSKINENVKERYWKNFSDKNINLKLKEGT